MLDIETITKANSKLISQANEIAELGEKVSALQFSLDEVGTRNLKADAIQEMLDACPWKTDKHRVFKWIKEYKDNLKGDI